MGLALVSSTCPRTSSRKLLANSDLVERLEQMEDFRSLREDASKIIAQSQKIRAAKKAQVERRVNPKTLTWLLHGRRSANK